MSTVIFVHGIGVRAQSLKNALKRSLQKGIDRLSRKQPSELGFCYWGGEYGTPFVETFESVPNMATDADVPAAQVARTAEEAALWELLYRDPDFELRLLGVQSTGRANLDAAEDMKTRIDRLNAKGELQAALDQAGLAASFQGAKQQVRDNPVLPPATMTPSQTSLREAVARAILARAVIIRLSDLDYPAFLAQPGERQALFTQILGGLGGPVGGVADWLAKRFLRKGTNYLSRNFGWAVREYYQTLGDIFHYQGVGGRQIRNAVRGEVLQAKSPVVLLGHSLGGIACVELLLEEIHTLGAQASPILGQITLLVTVGSQSPFLYEINALQSMLWDRAHGRPLPTTLPASFPRWLNIYDPEDLLSFKAVPVFSHPDRLFEQEVRRGQPFPQSHSAYWDNPETWDAIAQHL